MQYFPNINNLKNVSIDIRNDNIMAKNLKYCGILSPKSSNIIKQENKVHS